MTRPKKNPDELRSKRLPIAFSVREYLAIKDRANKENLPVSIWARKKLLNGISHGGR